MRNGVLVVLASTLLAAGSRAVEPPGAPPPPASKPVSLKEIERREAREDALGLDELFATVKPVTRALVRRIERRLEKVGWAKLTEAERRVLAVWELDAEVNNGGFDQYFFNSAGDHARELEEALAAIHAEKWRLLAHRAFAVFPGGQPPSSLVVRRRQLVKLSGTQTATLDAQDEEFYALERSSSESLESLLDAYAREHRADFGAR